MPLPSSGEIKMGGAGTNSIAQEKAGTSTGTPSAVQNVSLRGLSVDGVNDFEFTGGAATDIAGTPNSTAPFAMSEFHGYSQFAWGTPGSITTNVTDMFDMQTINSNGNSCDVATGIYIKHILASKRLDFFLKTTESGGTSTLSKTTNTASVTYTGTLSSLKGRFVYNNIKVELNDGNNFGSEVVFEAYATDHDIISNDVNSTGTGGTDIDEFFSLSESNDLDGSPNGFRTLGTTNNVFTSMMIGCHANGGSAGTEASFRAVANSGSTVAFQLQANGSDTVTLHTKTFTSSASNAGMKATSFDDDTS